MFVSMTLCYDFRGYKHSLSKCKNPEKIQPSTGFKPVTGPVSEAMGSPLKLKFLRIFSFAWVKVIEYPGRISLKNFNFALRINAYYGFW